MTAPAPARPGPLLLLAGLTLAGWMACALWPRLLAVLGIADYGRWFLDSHAVLAAVDAVRAGVDPNSANPLDPLLRNHKYSDWWFALRWTGLTREHNFAVGLAWVGMFLAAVGWTARPRTRREALWLAGLLLSPPVLLAVNRANNDLVIFTLIAACGVAAAGVTWWRQVLAIGLLVLATGLKFYPAPAALAFLWVRPLRRVPAVVLLALLAAGLTLASVWTQVAHAQFTIEFGLHLLGAPLFGRAVGSPALASLWFALLLPTVAAAGLVYGRWTTGLATRGLPQDRLLAALGAIVLLACFAAGVSYAYRWIFALWVALWLWRQAADGALGPRQAFTARVGCGLLFLCFWLDGAVCLLINVALPPMSAARVDEILLAWRTWTQPVYWLLMMLLAGWLLDALVTTWAEWRRPAATPAT